MAYVFPLVVPLLREAISCTKKALPFWGGALILVFIFWLIFRDDAQKLRINADNITVSTITQGEFNDYIRSGQTYYLNLQLGQPVEAVLIPRGAFYQKTGGKWSYVLTSDDTKATRRDIRIGHQNPQYYEVVEGLESGERVITSSYENFGESDLLVF